MPAAAGATFAAKFAGAPSAKWEKEKADYEVGFKQAGQTMPAVITPTGQLWETETMLPAAQLPAPVRATLARACRGYRVGVATTIVRANGRTVYEIELSRSDTKQDVPFTAESTVTK